jgi:teichuronic acid biosynthesis glycosyltransferase TuaC
MRVLSFTTLFPNSADPTHAIFVYQRLAHFARRPGNELKVVAPIPYVPSSIRMGRYRALSGVPPREQFGGLSVWHPRYFLLPGISMPLHGLLMFLGSLSLVRRLHRETRFDCIDAHYIYPDGLAAVLLGKVLRLPVIVSGRGSDINLFPSFHLIRPMIRWTLRESTGIISVSQALKQAMVKLDTPAEKIQVIGNGVDLDRFQRVEPAVARRQLGLPEDAQILVAVGALRRVKGYQFLLPALAGIVPRHPKLRLYIVGEGDYRPKLEAVIRELGLQERVVLVGKRPNEELKNWYSAANLSCLVSSREGWANVLLESLACGTPVLATRVWGAPEVIISPELGVLVEQDVSSIANGLESALKKRWDPVVLVRHARSRTWDDVAAEIERYFASRIATHG